MPQFLQLNLLTFQTSTSTTLPSPFHHQPTNKKRATSPFLPPDEENAFLRPPTPPPIMSKKGTLGIHKDGLFSSNFAPIFTQTARLAAKKKARIQTQPDSQPESQPDCLPESEPERLVIDEEGNLDKTAMPSSSESLLNETVIPSSETEIVSCTCSLSSLNFFSFRYLISDVQCLRSATCYRRS